MKLRQKTPTEKPAPLAEVVHNPGAGRERMWVDKRGRVYFWTLAGQLRRVPPAEIERFFNARTP